MSAAGGTGSFDLLGLDPARPPQPRAQPPQQTLRAEIDARPDVGGVREAPHLGEEAQASKRFTVRCEGRWRVRSAPSLSSKVIGTIANGTLVVGTEEPTDAAVQGGSDGSGSQGISSLWVRVSRFEAKEPMGVSEIKRDTASGGALFCLRRNALGYGLYETGVESLDGPLITLSETMSAELRSDAQRAAADKSEDVSLTWKLLGVAESVGRFFTQLSTAQDEGGVNEEMRQPVRRRPDEVFEFRQRDQLKKAAGTLKKAVQKIIAKAGTTSPRDVTAGLPKEVGRRFQRLRASLAATSTAPPLVVPAHRQPDAAAATPSVALAPPLPRRPAVPCLPQATEGSVADLEHFVELCARLERTGGWPELSSELRQEVTSFSVKHTKDLEDYARYLGKAAPIQSNSTTARGDGHTGGSLTASPAGGPAPAPMEPLIGDLDLTGSAVPAKPAAAAFGGLPLLPPPPPPASGVGAGPLL